MKSFHSRFPPGSTVLVDAPDTYQGAYVFRNGLSEAAELAGLRRDLHWRRGTVALLGPSAGRDLGVRLFEIGVDGGLDRLRKSPLYIVRAGYSSEPCACVRAELGFEPSAHQGDRMSFRDALHLVR
jgi:hypothetical protein